MLEVAVMLDPFTSSLEGVFKCKGGSYVIYLVS